MLTDGEDVVVVLHLGAGLHGEGASVAARVPSGDRSGELAKVALGRVGEDGKSSRAVASNGKAHRSADASCRSAPGTQSGVPRRSENLPAGFRAFSLLFD